MIVELGTVAAVSTVHTSHFFSCSRRHTFSSILSSHHHEILVDKSDEEYNVSHRVEKCWISFNNHT